MALPRSKNDPVRLLGKRMLVVGLLALVALASSAAWGAYQKARESHLMRAQAETTLSELSAREAELSADIAKLSTDRGKEEALREQYPLAKDGEGLIIIVDQASTQVSSPTPSMFDWFQRTLRWW